MPSTNKTPNLQLNQWAGNEYVKRQDFGDDNNKIDEAYGELKREIENKASDARGASFDNSTNGMAATNVQDAIEENKTSILSNKTNLDNLNTKVTNGQNHKITNDDGTAINSVGADLNNLTNTGTYVGNNWINAPSINYALVEVKKGTSGITKQLFTETTSTKQYLRIFRSGVWTTWRSL